MGRGKEADAVRDGGDSGCDFRQRRDGGGVGGRGGLEGEGGLCRVVADDVKQGEEVGADDGRGCVLG